MGTVPMWKSRTECGTRDACIQSAQQTRDVLGVRQLLLRRVFERLHKVGLLGFQTLHKNARFFIGRNFRMKNVFVHSRWRDIPPVTHFLRSPR